MGKILHVDGDSFFASVETSLNPALRGKPVVTGAERGIASSMSKEAKALGVHRGMPVYQIRKLFPQVVIVQSDYHNYSIFAQRMYNIVRRYTSEVEEYSIDECFADFTAVKDPMEAARRVKNDLQKELGVTFSIGLGPTKVLAKVASKWNKPDGFTVLEKKDIKEFLTDMEIGKIWGIGPQTTHALQRMGIKTALDFIGRSEDWIRGNLHKRELELWYELRGQQVFNIHSFNSDMPGSIQHTRTFNPPTDSRRVLFSELSKNVEGACAKARLEGVMARKVYYFLKTQEFRYHRREIALPQPLQAPNEILEYIKGTLEGLWRPGVEYRATGVTLSDLIDEDGLQNDLFGEVAKKDKYRKIFKIVDHIDRRYGEGSIILGSSLHSMTKKGRKAGFSRRFKLPFMGEVV